ncbi:hypothetical protein F2Q69_00006028 [Brassica cretica]|uniref:Uncharacterized protein n=1 Tax=Brassica cretica TaxID=69181 RepID=A0A8S9NL65_BRACR|nr:hypothetical protein F2Q69_00006028 [Brassica cretica]
MILLVQYLEANILPEDHNEAGKIKKPAARGSEQGHLVATGQERAGRYVATDPRMSRSLCSNRRRHSVGHYVATDPRTSRSLRSDRPSHLFSRYVATDPARIRSLCCNRTVSNVDQWVRPKSVHSRLFLNASSYVPQPYHFSLPSIGVIT